MPHDRRVEILILSWAPDARWLHYALQSIRRFARGFEGVTVVYPDRDDTVLRRVCDFGGARAHPHVEPPPPLGHLSQNLAKCKADLYCPAGTTHVLHFDSDSIFNADVTPDDFFRDGKPLLVHRRWEDAADANYWREPTRRALGWDPPFETMAFAPLIYDVRAYAATRRHVSDTHGGIDFDRYVLGCKPTFPYGFCEHNTLGAFVLEKAPDLCAPVLVPPWDGLPIKARQLWSHDGLQADMADWLEEVIREGRELRPPPRQGGMTPERRKLLGLD